VARAEPLPEFEFFEDWVRRGRAASMTYLTDHRAAVRRDPRNLLPGAKSILMGAVLYHADAPLSTEMRDPSRGWISRYAWGERDYHDVLRERFEKLAPLLPPCEYRICVDTAPLLERAYARRAGLGWIGKNTCLINEPQGSWFFLGAMLLSLELEPGTPPPDRCGSCTRCIDACPTAAIVATGRDAPAWEIDSAKCISYHTIESREEIPEPLRPAHGNHVFGCDICQDVCPWNARAPVTGEPAFQPVHFAPPLDELAAMSEADFRARFRGTPVWRAKYQGLMRNVATARGNSGRIEECHP
jgi:epoxyqueuosine reductase